MPNNIDSLKTIDGESEQLAQSEVNELTDSKVSIAANKRVQILQNEISDMDDFDKDVIENNDMEYGALLAETADSLEKSSSDEEKEKILKEAREKREENKRKRNKVLIEKIAAMVWPDKDVANEKKEQLLRAFTKSDDSNETIDLLDFLIEYKAKKIAGEDTTEMLVKLKSTGLPDEAIESFLRSAEENIGTDELDRNEVDKMYDFALSNEKHFLQVAEGIDINDLKKMNTSEVRSTLKERFENIAKTDEEFREFVERQDKREMVIELMKKEIALREVAKTSQKIPDVLQSTSTAESFNALSASAQAQLTQIVEGGGSAVVSSMLQGNMQPSDNGYMAEVSGVDVELNVADGNLYIVGEHAKENLVNKSEYKIDPPTAAGFDQTYAKMIVDQNEVASLAEPGMRLVLLGLVGKFGEDAENATIMGEDEANRFHNFIQLMFGEDNIEASEEMQRLADLGITGGSEGGQGFSVNNQRLQRIHRAMVEYVPRTSDPVKLHELGMDYRHFAALAALWDYTGNDTILPNVSDLKQLTDELDGNADAKKIALKEFCVKEGYIVG